MKTATFPSLQVDSALRQAAEESLRHGETLSDFIEQAIRDSISRRQYQRDLSARGLAGHGEAIRTADYVSADAVLLQLENMLAKAKASN